MPEDSENIAQLRQRAEEAARFEDEVVALKRQLALRDSGYRPDNPLVAHLMGTYAGDPTPEAIETFLSGLGVTRDEAPKEPAPAEETQQPVTFDPQVATNRRSLSSDSQPPAANQRVRTDPYEAALLHKQHGLANGRDPDTLIQEGLAAVLGAGAMGDERVIIRAGRTGYADPRTMP